MAEGRKLLKLFRARDRREDAARLLDPRPGIIGPVEKEDRAGDRGRVLRGIMPEAIEPGL